MDHRSVYRPSSPAVAARIPSESVRFQVKAARRYPLPTAAVLAGRCCSPGRPAYHEPYRRRETARRLSNAARPWVNKFNTAWEGYERARGGLFVIEPYGAPTVEEVVARHLARRRGPATLTSLAGIAEPLHQITAEELEDALHAHPAFVIGDDDTYTVGRPALRALPAF